MAKRKRRRPPQLAELLRSDGALCLTFVNPPADSATAPDASYGVLLDWGVQVGTIDAQEARRLDRATADHLEVAISVARRARTLRHRLERIFLALIDGNQPAAVDLGAFNVELSTALAARQIVATARGFQWSWSAGNGDDLGRILWPILLNAANLLASEDHRLIRRCGDPACGRLFVAHGAGRPRKWCGAACRTRSTSRSHYHAKVKPDRQKIQQRLQAEQVASLAGYGDAWQPPESDS